MIFTAALIHSFISPAMVQADASREEPTGPLSSASLLLDIFTVDGTPL